jgi:hypothetical protein
MIGATLGIIFPKYNQTHYSISVWGGNILMAFNSIWANIVLWKSPDHYSLSTILNLIACSILIFEINLTLTTPPIDLSFTRNAANSTQRKVGSTVPGNKLQVTQRRNRIIRLAINNDMNLN